MTKVWILLATAGSMFGSTMYTVVDLGPFNANVPAFGYNGPSPGVLPGGSWSAAYGSNDLGDVVGYGDIANGYFRGFVWTAASGMTELGTLGGLDSYAMAINDSDEVVGHSSTSSGYIQAFVWSNGNFIDLGTLGGTSSYAYGINDAGTVVGYSTTSNGSLRAFIDIGGVMFDLNGLTASNSGWILNEAYAIDDAGQITGTGMFEGSMHAFRLDPVAQPAAGTTASPIPEPSTMLLIGAGLLALSKRLKVVF